MDYRGQKLSEKIHYILVILFGGIAWLVGHTISINYFPYSSILILFDLGYYYSDFQHTFHGWLAGLALSLLICIPDWPFFNKNKVEWLDELPDHSVAYKASQKKKIAGTTK